MKGRVLLEKEEIRAAGDAFQRGMEALRGEGDLGGQEKGQAPAFSLLLSVARSAIETGDLPVADDALDKAARASPESWEPHYWRGRLELARGDPRKAASLFSEAAGRGGGALLDLTYWNAVALEKLGDGAGAVARLREVVRSTPGFLPAVEDLARLSPGEPAGTGTMDDARARLRAARAEVKRLEKDADSRPLSGCGPTYLELGKLGLSLREPSAFDYLFLSADLDPGAEVYRLILSGLKQSQDVFVRARFLRLLLGLEPADESALHALAEVYLKLHVRLDEAERIADALHRLKPSAASWRLRGEAALLRGDRERAGGILRQGLAAFPGDEAIRGLLERAAGP